MKGKYLKRGLMCGIVAASLCMAMISAPFKSYAISRVEVDKECSLTVAVGEDYLIRYPELGSVNTEVELYRIASITEAAEYTLDEAFGDSLTLPPSGGVTKTQSWDTVAEEAAKLLGLPYGKTEAVEAVVHVEPVVFDMTNGTGSKGGLETGLYLVNIRDAKTAHHVYSFLPYLVSLPNNEYMVVHRAEDGTETRGADDEWLYGVTVGLKPEEHVRTGDVVIKKDLDSYNPLLGPATFIFKVNAYQIVAGEEVQVYSDIVTLEFTGEGEMSAVASGIPLGSTVTVEEIYSTGAYHLTQGGSGEDGSWTITLEQDAADPNADVQEEVAFRNDTTDRTGRGTSIVNHFADDGTGWRWSNNRQEENQ